MVRMANNNCGIFGSLSFFNWH